MRKIVILSLCFVLVAAIFACSAAADITVTSNFGEDTPTIGDDNQEASNPELDDDDSDYNVYAEGNVRLSNNGTSNVTINAISVSYTTGMDAGDLNISLKNSVIVPAGGTVDAVLSARVSEKLDAVNTKQKAVAFNIADVSFKTGSVTQTSSSVWMQRENNLEIDNVEVEVGDDSTSINDDGEKVEDVKPGDSVKIIVIAENKYSDDADIEIDADDGKWEIRGDVDEDDDIDFGTIDADSSDEEYFTFTVDENADGTEDFIIYVYGEDEFGAKHGHRIEANFEVKKNTHEIKIDSATVVPLEIECGKTAVARVKVVNIGKKNEDQVSIQIKNTELDIDTWVTDIELKEGKSKTQTIELPIPSDATVGNQPFTVIAYYDYNEETDRETFNLDITCDAAAADDSADNDTAGNGADDDTATPPAITGGGTVDAQPTSGSTGPAPITSVSSSSRSSGFRSGTIYILLLILAIVIVVLIGAFLIAKMLIAK